MLGFLSDIDVIWTRCKLSPGQRHNQTGAKYHSKGTTSKFRAIFHTSRSWMYCYWR